MRQITPGGNKVGAPIYIGTIEKEESDKIFAFYDRDGSKKIERDEFRYLCHDRFRMPDTKKVNALLNLIFIASDGEGKNNYNDEKLNKDEFYNILKLFPEEFKNHEIDLCQVLFKLVDRKSTGSITFGDLHRFLTKHYSLFGLFESISKMKEYDTDNNKELDFDEFYKLVFDMTCL